jgi:gamma-glutamyltranspeptidase/glutathione hydrolase
MKIALLPHSFLLTALILSPAFANVAQSKRGMVASVHPIATDAGVKVLAEGGNAIDAAVTTALMLGVVDGHNSGIGGGCFMLIRTADGKTYALDGRETAPAAAMRDMYIREGKPDTTLSQTGPLAVGIPGSVAVYEYAVKNFGKKPLADAIAPAADVADKGFAIDAPYAVRLRATHVAIERFPATAAILLKEGGKPYGIGETLVQKDLARTYRSIADQGADYFYKGGFARSVAEWMRDNGGIIVAGDFARYEMKLREPLVTQYRGHTIVGFPPPSSGGLHVAQILTMVERFNLNQMEKREPATRVHVMAEAMKLAFADRAEWLGDPDFVKVPTGLIDANYLARRSKLIDPTRAIDDAKPGNPGGDGFGKHTTHIAAADAEGNWVALTTTVNTAFGSKVIVPGTGVILNNQMDDFSISPGAANAFGLVGNEANAIAPGKRPLSSMSPTIVLKDGQPVLTVGAAGGPRIITQVTLLISNLIDLGDTLDQAIGRKRFHHQWSPGKLFVEEGFPAEVSAALEKLGHKLDRTMTGGATQAIMRGHEGTFFGASEPRIPGKAAGP